MVRACISKCTVTFELLSYFIAVTRGRSRPTGATVAGCGVGEMHIVLVIECNLVDQGVNYILIRSFLGLASNKADHETSAAKVALLLQVVPPAVLPRRFLLWVAAVVLEAVGSAPEQMLKQPPAGHPAASQWHMTSPGSGSAPPLGCYWCLCVP